jgi:hypothetical protein
MLEKKLASFRGVRLKCVPFEAWDNDKLLTYLGDKAKDFRRNNQRKYFDLVKRRAIK